MLPNLWKPASPEAPSDADVLGDVAGDVAADALDDTLAADVDPGADGAAQAGAEDAVTAANGWPLPADGGAPFAACRAYLRAIYAADWKALRLVVAGEAATLFDESSDFRIAQGLRPAAPSPAGGFCNALQATVTVQGVTRGGFVATWTYQLRLLDGVWKVERERWD